jgi:capsular exopolysaccharide synthesis family protein
MALPRSLDIMRRWRLVIVAGVLIGVAVGGVSGPGKAAVGTTFEATNTLLLDPRVSNGSFINQAAVMATMGAVPDRVAARLGLDGSQVRSMVSAGTHDNEGEVLITARSTTRAEAEALANVTAQELLVELGGSRSPLKVLEPAVASPVTSDDIKGPTSRPGRALLLGGFGLLLGIGAAFVVERFDNRIRTRRDAEEALGVAVMAEVPSVPRLEHGRLVPAEQSSPFVEAYRGLRTMVVRWASAADEGAGHPVIVVTSAVGREGKTTTVAHLAAALAEIGRSVVAVSADLRRPQLHAYFDKAREPGLADLLRGAPDVRRIDDLNLATSVRGVRVVASGAPVRNPSPLIDQLGEHLKEARELADFVLVDTPPLLTASEAADIAHLADGVLLVVRAGRTSIGAAARSAELLERLGIPLVGAVLVAGDRVRAGRVRT